MNLKQVFGLITGINISKTGLTGGSDDELNAASPSISPAAGIEEVSNVEFTTDYTGWTANNATLSVVDSTSDPGLASGGADNNCIKVVDAGSEAAARSGDISVPVRTWCQMSARLYTPSTNTGQNNMSLLAGTTAGGEGLNLIKTTQEDIWNGVIGTFLAIPAACHISLSVYGAPNNDVGYADKVSVKPLTFSTCIALIGSRLVKNGTYTCRPVVALHTQAGMLVEYKDENNFVMLIVDRSGTTSAKLIKRVSGTYTVVITGNITYVSGALLKAIVDGTNHSLYYNGAQVGTTQVIDNSGMGLDVYGFTPYGNNSAGQVVTYATVNP